MRGMTSCGTPAATAVMTVPAPPWLTTSVQVGNNRCSGTGPTRTLSGSGPSVSLSPVDGGAVVAEGAARGAPTHADPWPLRCAQQPARHRTATVVRDVPHRLAG